MSDLIQNKTIPWWGQPWRPKQT